MKVCEFIKLLEYFPCEMHVLATWEGGYSSLHRIFREKNCVIIDVDHYRGNPDEASKEYQDSLRPVVPEEIE